MKRRADVAGILPGEASITRPIGAVLLERNDERQLQHRPMRVEGVAEPTASSAGPEPARSPAQAAPPMATSDPPESPPR